MGRAGGQPDGAQQRPDRVPADFRDGDGGIKIDRDSAFKAESLFILHHQWGIHSVPGNPETRSASY